MPIPSKFKLPENVSKGELHLTTDDLANLLHLSDDITITVVRRQWNNDVILTVVRGLIDDHTEPRDVTIFLNEEPGTLVIQGGHYPKEEITK